MSRRVFDVGLDIGRIKNGLKLNKEGKSTKTTRSASTKYANDPNSMNQQLALIPKLQNKHSVPNVRALDGHDQDPNSEPVVLPSPRDPEPTMHGGFPRPPSHPGSPVNEEFASLDRRFSTGDLNQSFDLRPPPPRKSVKLLDTLSEQLFSGDHLHVILRDPSFFLRFTAFLNRYKPQSAPVLVRYLEAQKAMKAVEYANAVAQSIKSLPGDPPGQIPCAAASIDPTFEARATKAFGSLATEALPAYITQALVKVVTESMVREITGNTMPVMQELVGGLAEVFCLSDPSLKDNPIIYASEEFYRTTEYGRDYVIGRNCRFLQGPKTDKYCVARMSAAVKAGQEFSEAILNYRRDGSPFMNLLMIAPLYDNRGTVRYYIGAQVDISGLIEEGRGFESFARLLEEKPQGRQRDNDLAQEKLSLRTLNEFGQMLSLEESSVFKSHSRSSSLQDNASSTNFSTRGASRRREAGTRKGRRVLGNEENDDETERSTWGFATMGPSGKLPGVYQNYLLVRPYPSLRIVFVSSGLRIPGLLQSLFLSRVGGPAHVRDGLSEAFEAGAAVTAKVLWFPQGRPTSDNSTVSDEPTPSTSNDLHSENSRPTTRRGPTQNHNMNGMNGDNNSSRTRYISCTPLLGSDDQVGVWMVVMVENEQVTGGLASREMLLRRYGEVPPTPSEYEREDYPHPPSAFAAGKPSYYNGANCSGPKTNGGQIGNAVNNTNNNNNINGTHGESARLYADFMRVQAKGRGGTKSEAEVEERDREGRVMEGMLEGLGDGQGQPAQML